MSDPKLKTARVTIHYTSDNGYSAEFKVKGKRETPHGGLIEGLEELARLTALFGFEDEAAKAFNAARARVAAWRKAR